MKTLEIYKYRGVRVFLRQVHRETFEYLIPWCGELYCNQFVFAKKRGEKTRQYTEDELARIVESLKYVANAFIDDEKFKRSPSATVMLAQSPDAQLKTSVMSPDPEEVAHVNTPAPSVCKNWLAVPSSAGRV